MIRFTRAGAIPVQPPNGAQYAVPDLSLALLRVDDGKTRRLIGREGQEAVADAAMEREVETELESRLIAGRLPAEPDLGRKVQEDGQVRSESTRRDLFQRSERRKWHACTVPLIGERGVGETGANDGRPGFDRWSNHFRDELSARGAKKERVGEGIDRCPGGRAADEQQVAETLAQARTARFARPEHGHSLAPEVRLEARGLRGLPGALRPFDGDEPAAFGRRGGACHAAECTGRSGALRPQPANVPGPPAGHPIRPRPRTLGVMGRRSIRLIRATALALLCAATPATVLAHPLGNFTINHYAGIAIAPDEIRLDVVIDMAEIPAFQERQKIDLDGDGDVTDTESAAAAGPACETQGALLRLAVDGVASELASTAASIAFPPGLGGLSTMRIECAFTARLATARERPIVTFKDLSYPDRIGWREIVATATGVVIESGGLPTTSPSLRLTKYPADLLVEPLDVRSATIAVAPAEPLPAATTAPVDNYPIAAGNPGAVPGGVAAELPTIFSVVDLTPLIIVLSLVTAFAFGAGHALTPGHGKTLMAAYLVGTRGTPLHAAGLGLSVAISHTIGILVLAALVVGAHGLLPPDILARAAPVVSAVTIVAIGGWMLFREVRRRRVAAQVAAPDHGHEHEHEHEHPGEHSHGGIRHSHLPPADAAIGWRGLFALGLAGGLIPSTSALFILLGSIVAGRPAFGFVLVVAFGLGMAAVMAGVGLAMVFARDRLDRLPSSSGLGRIARQAPLAAAVFVLGFGAYLTVQALGGQPVF